MTYAIDYVHIGEAKQHLNIVTCLVWKREQLSVVVYKLPRVLRDLII